MADEAFKEASTSTPEVDDSLDSTIEINIKTLDSHIHKLRVKKDVPVQVLKEKIVNVTGVPVDQQRLIFRGKVLKDDHLISEYHVENGYTLHLVARRAAEGEHTSGTTSEDNTQHNVNVAGSGEGMFANISREILEAMTSQGVVDDMARSVRDILGSLSLGMLPSGGVSNTSTVSVVPLNGAPEGANNFSGRIQQGSQPQPRFTMFNQHIQASSLPPAGVIPDSLMTLLEFINHMDQVLQNNGIPPSSDSNTQQVPRSDDDASLNPRFPSPDVLGSVIQRAQQLLGNRAASALSHIAQRIERDSNSTDASVRSQIQSETIQLGVAMQHLGAMLLELGRTMMMLRMGQSPAEAFVNAGSAVYINSAGPNPIMVQPSLQMAPAFGVSAAPVVTGVSGPFGAVDPSRAFGVGDPSRNISIHIHGTSAASGPSVGTSTASGDAVNMDRQNVERTQDGSVSANSTSIRGLPTRTVIAAIPARSPVEGPSHVLNVILPVQVRTQATAPVQSTSSQGSQTTAGVVSQPNSTVLVPQTSSVAGGIPAIVAQITARVANALAANAPGQVSSSAQDAANHASNPPTHSVSGTSSSGAPAAVQMQNEPSSTTQEQASRVQSHVAPADATLCTVDVPSSSSVDKSAQKNEPSDGIAAGPGKTSAGDKPTPLGLGLAGLQPKRRSRSAKLSGSSETLDSVNQNQEAVARGQKVLQSLFSQRADDANISDVRGVAPSSSSMHQFTDGMLPRRQSAQGPVDVGNMISGVLNTPAFGNLLSNVAAQTGVGSATDLRSMMEQCTQNPAMRDTINNVVQNVDGQDSGSMFGSERGQSGIDFSRMMQQMMPVVSQVLGGGSACPFDTNGAQSGHQPQHNYNRAADILEGRNSKIDLHQACASIEQCDSPENIFHAVVESACQLYGADDGIHNLLGELSSDPELANDYMKFLLQQIRERIQSESDSRKMS